jgi:hypothetical protein
MVALSQYTESATVKAIYEARERANKPWPSRRIGGSDIGKPCSRATWYKFRWCYTSRPEGRVLRLFETGQLEEERVVNDLRSIGCTVLDVDEERGGQWTFVELGGHLVGKFDAVLCGLPEAPKTWHLGEFKTHNTKNFNRIKRHGVYKAKPEHWAQMQTYMGLGKLKRALYFTVHKDTDELYTERVHFDRDAYEGFIRRARQIIESPEPLTRIADKPDYFECQFCAANEICHMSKVPAVSCRTCVYSTPVIEGEYGTWVCERYPDAAMEITYDEQKMACGEHLFIPPLLSCAEPTNTGPGWVSYKLDKGDLEFVNCGADGFPAQDLPHYSSRQLAAGDWRGNQHDKTARLSGGSS